MNTKIKLAFFLVYGIDILLIKNFNISLFLNI